jgi:alpha-beta hydrolase superfamily lysophospholipase
MKDKSYASRLGRRAIRTGIALALVWLIASLGVAYRLTHRPRPLFPEPAPRVTWGLLESHRIRTSDGQELGAWYSEGRDDAPSVLLLHGNRGSRANCLRLGELFAARGCAVLMISLRAHGDSTGDYHDVGFAARRDVLAGVDFLSARRTGRPIVIMGTSMGAAAAIFAGGELGDRVAGYILQSPYQDLKTAAWHRVDTYLPPVLSHAAYAGLRLVGPLFLPHLDEISPLNAISEIPRSVPILILAGDADRLARIEEARAIHRRVVAHARLVVFPGAQHNNLAESAPELHKRTIGDFLSNEVGLQTAYAPFRQPARR